MAAPKLTRKLLEAAFADLPDTTQEDHTEWFTNSGLDHGTVLNFARRKFEEARTVPFEGSAWLALGIMIGINVGLEMSDPSFALAVELESPHTDDLRGERDS